MNKVHIRRFPAMFEKNFRKFFATQLFSATGTFLQGAALLWLVKSLSKEHAPINLGISAGLQFLPLALISLVGGILTDLSDRRLLLLVIQVAGMLIAILLGILALMGMVTIPIIFIFSGITGIIGGVDGPARQAFTTSLVRRKHRLTSALGLSSGMTTAAQAIGPGMAGVLLIFMNPGFLFIINGLTYLPVIAALWTMRVEPHEKDKQHPWQMLKEGFSWVSENRDVMFAMVVPALAGISVRSYGTILSVMASDVYHNDTYFYGLLLAVLGIGAACGGFGLSALPKSVSTRTRILIGISVSTFSLAGLGLLSSHSTEMRAIAIPALFALGSFLLFLNGFGYIFIVSSCSAYIQHKVDEPSRGRVYGIFYCIIGTGIFSGNFAIGGFTEALGLSNCSYLFSGMTCIVGIVSLIAMLSWKSSLGRLAHF